MIKTALLLSRLETRFVGWVYTNKLKLFRFIFLGAFLTFVSSLPYLNLIFSHDMLIHSMVIIGLIIFYPTTLKLVVMSLTTVAFSLLFTLIGDLELAEVVSNFTYLLLVFIVFRFTFKNA